MNPGIDSLLRTIGPYNGAPNEYNYEFAKQQLRSSKILVIGAGGLGCEILKNLALTGFTDIHIIDMDSIDLSNLNRQFLFRKEDINKSKAEVAARFVKSRVKNRFLKIVPYYGRIQDKPVEYYQQFSCIICGLDSVEARRWINATVVAMVGPAMENLVPIIDGGTEGFRGQSRVIIPTVTSCYECTLHMLTPKVTYPVCTIANTPRLPEHCIEWASELAWGQKFSVKFDADNEQHVDWVFEQAQARGRQFHIGGITRSLTLGVVKSIIPSIASTNAIIAASCCNEAFKILTDNNGHLDNYMMYSGDDSVFTYTFEAAKNPGCPVCGTQTKTVRCQNWWTLETFISEMRTMPELQVKNPSLSTAGTKLYFAAPPSLYEATKQNLCKRVKDLVSEDDEIAITDSSLPISLRVKLEFEGPESEPANIDVLVS
ncbi:hypothetical protein CANTEDRAFT_122668 [Yamadazyma tenuis ATCC 10573]|uniref:NEDD8-activating enzyme E1 catalytic subunit n=2 Tax=Candida tenuis TaxID=2315449 RepID=G3B6S5_CANTC|nr:uncharacterized protein CANTEDRAFT_122668 [Yamadazyma tenuis ATCC 10573]EGV63007.1 hypothetical protein CANTEDRAFT_122668 [Yamadazyma tenuis ATCC 10573]